MRFKVRNMRSASSAVPPTMVLNYESPICEWLEFTSAHMQTDFNCHSKIESATRSLGERKCIAPCSSKIKREVSRDRDADSVSDWNYVPVRRSPVSNDEHLKPAVGPHTMAPMSYCRRLCDASISSCEIRTDKCVRHCDIYYAGEKCDNVRNNRHITGRRRKRCFSIHPNDCSICCISRLYTLHRVLMGCFPRCRCNQEAT